MTGLLAIARVWIALVFLLGEGTSNLLDCETTADGGATLSIAGAVALAIGLWTRPEKRRLGDVLIVVGAGLAAIWYWAVVVTPVAIVVIVGVIFSQVRKPSPAAETSWQSGRSRDLERERAVGS